MDTKVSVQALYFISKLYNNDNVTNKMGALKLLFFAEKYHLQMYGRMITDDTFFAMKNGPVASGARDILSFDNMNYEGDYASDYIGNIDSNFYKIVADNKDELDMLSETDIEALKFAIDEFGHLNQWDLVKETHKYQEWKRYEKLFLSENTKREDVILEDFFLNTESESDPYKSISNSHVELSKTFYLHS